MLIFQLTLNKISSRAWDIVILQEQSQRPAFDEEQVCRDTVAPLDTLVKLIRDSSPNATIQVNFRQCTTIQAHQTHIIQNQMILS